MASLKAEITIKPDTKLVFNEDKIVECNTRSFVISDSNLPEYNAYPNSGRLVIKDTDLSIYNMALNGEFDNYQYPIDLFMSGEHKNFISNYMDIDWFATSGLSLVKNTQDKTLIISGTGFYVEKTFDNLIVGKGEPVTFSEYINSVDANNIYATLLFYYKDGSTDEKSTGFFKTGERISVTLNSKLDKEISSVGIRIARKGDNISFYNATISDLQVISKYNKIAHHIVNQRPEYDYENKTISFNLGNVIDFYDTKPFQIYDYPLKSQTITEILKSYLGISEQDFQEMLSMQYSQDKTFEGIFNGISCEYPYSDKKTAREALQDVLSLAQCGMYVDKDNKFRLINLNGDYFANKQNPDLSKVIFIPPQEIKEPFLPSVILSNRYNQVNVDYKNVEIERHFDELCQQNEISPVFLDVITPIRGNSISYKKDEYEVDPYTIHGWVVAQKVNKAYYVDYPAEIKKLQKNNLFSISKIVDKITEELKKVNSGTISNPNFPILVTVKKITTKFNGTFDYDEFINADGYGNTFFRDSYQISRKEEYINLDIWNNRYGSYEYNFGNGSITANTSLDFGYGAKPIIETKDTYTQDLYFYAGKTIETYYGDANPYYDESTGQARPEFSNCNVTKIKEEYIPEKIEVSYYGNYSLITFNDSTHIINNSSGKLVNPFTLTNGNNKLMQQANAQAIATQINGIFSKGVHTGELSVIPHNDRLYEIGDIVTPCKDYNNTPILNVYYQVVDIETTYDNGAVFQKLILREVK